MCKKKCTNDDESPNNMYLHINFHCKEQYMKKFQTPEIFQVCKECYVLKSIILLLQSISIKGSNAA